MRKLVALLIGLILAGVAVVATTVIVVTSDLPKMITLQDYQPLLVSEVFDRNGNKIGEFFREKRMLVPYEQIPQHLVQAFISAEDSSFFQHSGLNYLAMMRAALANLKAGRKAQGASTITQQVSRSLLLSSEKTYTRKLKEIFLAYKMEQNLSKQDILYLYLNQIYLGQGAYGVEAASQVYFRKSVKDLTVAECALIAGLPQAPSKYSPISNPTRAKERQQYVLGRMTEEGYLKPDEAKRWAAEPVKIYVWKNYKEIAPFYLETIRQLLVARLGEEMVLDKGIKVYTGLDMAKQIEAQNQVQIGLRELDKRQGYRGPLKNLDNAQAVADFLLAERDALIDEVTPERILKADGTMTERKPLNVTGKDERGAALPTVPTYIKTYQIVKAIVTKVDDKYGVVAARFAESRGLIDLETMKWARKPDSNIRPEADPVKKPSAVLKVGDVILVKVVSKSFTSSRLAKEMADWRKKNKATKNPEDFPVFSDYAALELEQEPAAEAALVSIDQASADIIALVGGYDFSRSQFNRAIQALRQTGSSFKSFVYTAALDKGYTAATPVIDAPLVYEEAEKPSTEEGQDAEDLATKKWKPANHSKTFAGEVLFRTALVKSLNVPTVKIIEKIGVDWVANYARRLGIFSPLNMDFTLALGSSGVTVYEMTRAFSVINRMGKRVRPLLVHKVKDKAGATLVEEISMDERFTTELSKIEEDFSSRRTAYLEAQKSAGTPPPEANANTDQATADQAGATQAKSPFSKEPPLFFDDPDQLIRPQSAYVITSLLQGVIDDPGGTGGAARSLGRPAAAKTGSTSGYYDAWFIGFTPDITTGVWVGFDEERSLGRGEVGGRAALPIWLEYMKFAHEGLPARGFSAPPGIVYANIDGETGKLASASTKTVVRQAFIDGSEPQEVSGESAKDQDQQFYKEDLSD